MVLAAPVAAPVTSTTLVGSTAPLASDVSPDSSGLLDRPPASIRHEDRHQHISQAEERERAGSGVGIAQTGNGDGAVKAIPPLHPQQALRGPLGCDREVAIFSKSALDDVVLRASNALE